MMLIVFYLELCNITQFSICGFLVQSCLKIHVLILQSQTTSYSGCFVFFMGLALCRFALNAIPGGIAAFNMNPHDSNDPDGSDRSNQPKLTEINLELITSFWFRTSVDRILTIKGISQIITRYSSFKFPSCLIDFSDQEIECKGSISVTAGRYFVYNSHYQRSWLLYAPSSRMICEFEIGEEFADMMAMPNDLVLVIQHLSSYIRDDSFDAPISIQVNRHEICNDFAPQSHGMITDCFPLDQSVLKMGKNEIRIMKCSDGRSNYWIRTLAVTTIKRLWSVLDTKSIEENSQEVGAVELETDDLSSVSTHSSIPSLLTDNESEDMTDDFGSSSEETHVQDD